MDVSDPMTLVDWRRTISELYASVRSEPHPVEGWGRWRAARDHLFRTHPQSPLPEETRASFGGLSYYDYDPSWRLEAMLETLEPERHEVPTSAGDPMVFERFGRANFEASGEQLSLEVYWLSVYGGGIYLPFRDATSGSSTYGAGRYLLDTIKGADLGMSGGRLVLDFNFAYNPSCSYDPRWACPLAPPANKLSVAVRAGERL